MSFITADSLQAFFGWCTLINFLILGVAALTIGVMRDTMMTIHSGMFGVDKSELPAAYFRYMGNYKIAIVVFNFVPWLALLIMR